MPEIWKNWAGNQRALVDIVRPTTEHELCAIVRRAASEGHRIRVVGSGHSCSDAAVSHGTSLSLEDYGRVLALDAEAGLLTVQAGARIRDLSGYLWSRGLAFENLGHCDLESLAGAISTGTHGTGLGFATLSAGVVGMRIVDGAGDVVECDENTEPELWRAARVAMGALGILSTITLRVVPAFSLHTVEEPLPLGAVMEAFDDVVADNDHYEFAWVPHAERALTRRSRRNHEPPEPRTRTARWGRERLWTSGISVAADRAVSARPSRIPGLARKLPVPGRAEYNERSFEVFATPHPARFVEMEYALPLEATVGALGEVRRWLDANGSPTVFPVGVRTAAADDIPLSTAQGRATGYVAVRTPPGTPHERYFRGVEDIMVAHTGRPHWGKLHFRTADDLAPAYPGWESFRRVRARMDPDGVFANAYTDRVLGPAG